MANAPFATHEPGRGLGLSSILEIVRRRRALAWLPFLFVLTAVASLALFLPGLWTAKALVLVDRQQIPEAFVKPTVTGDLEGQLLTLSQEILSRSRLMQIIGEHNLYPKLRHQSADEIVDRMRRDIRIEFQSDDRERRPRDPRTIAFSVAYTTTNPYTAMVVANRLASLYVEENVRYREKQAIGTSEFLEAQLKEVRARLQEQERRVTEYKEKHLGELPEQRDSNLRTLERLQQQRQVAYENNRRANERRQLITQSLAEIDQTGPQAPTASSAPNVTPAESAAARLNLLKQELVQMQTRFSDRYPDVIAMKEQIRALEAKVAAEPPAAAAVVASAAPPARRDGKELRVAPQNPYIQSLMQQLDQATVESKATGAEIANLNRMIEDYQRRIENTPKREQELALITRDYETTREGFRSLLSKRGEAEIAADLEQRQKGERFRVIDPAAVPERPAGPNRMRLFVIGFVLALGASGIAVLLAEQVDTSYRNVDQVRATMPVPVLSAIPRISTDRDRVRTLQRRRLATAAVAAGLIAVIGASFAVAHNNESLVALLTPADSMGARR